jgi:uncharacterized membrane protein YdjX (TVP38/TMEM64 family)
MPDLHGVSAYAVAFATIFAVNMLPALTPPTWALLVALLYAFGLEPRWLVPLGAAAAAGGRLALALLARRFRATLSAKRLEGLQALKSVTQRDRRRTLLAVLLFLWSPLPSNQLFIAAGLMNLPLRTLTLAFLAGRLLTYTFYVQGALYIRRSVGDLWRDHLLSPSAIVVQVLVVVALGVLVFVDWARVLSVPPQAPPADGAPPPPHPPIEE